MRRRVLLTTLAVAVIAVVLFGAPLAVAVRNQYQDQATLRLATSTIEAARTIGKGAIDGTDPAELPGLTATRFALYRPDGSFVLGRGPRSGDADVASAASNKVSDSRRADSIVVAVPIVAEEAVIGVLRGEQSSSIIDDRVRRAWLAMAAIATVAVGLAGIIGALLARHLNRPIEHLRRAAIGLGEGDYTIAVPSSGVGELDDVASALTGTATRLGNLIARERSFSADASHQLRTPLTGLRLILETELDAPRADHDQALCEALVQVDRLEATIDDLLTLARDTSGHRDPLDLHPFLADVEKRWHGRLAEGGRPLRLDISDELPRPRVSRAAVANIIDVLIDNAQRHGSGEITLAAHPVDGGVTIAVSDEGNGVVDDRDRIFERGATDTTRRPDRHGIGLALARSLAEAEGGRLHLAINAPHPRFELVLST